MKASRRTSHPNREWLPLRRPAPHRRRPGAVAVALEQRRLLVDCIAREQQSSQVAVAGGHHAALLADGVAGGHHASMLAAALAGGHHMMLLVAAADGRPRLEGDRCRSIAERNSLVAEGFADALVRVSDAVPLRHVVFRKHSYPCAIGSYLHRTSMFAVACLR